MIEIITASEYSLLSDIDCTYEFPEKNLSPFEQCEWLDEKIGIYAPNYDLTIKTFSPFILSYMTRMIEKYDLTKSNLTVHHLRRDIRDRNKIIDIDLLDIGGRKGLKVDNSMFLGFLGAIES